MAVTCPSPRPPDHRSGSPVVPSPGGPDRWLRSPRGGPENRMSSTHRRGGRPANLWPLSASRRPIRLPDGTGGLVGVLLRLVVWTLAIALI